MTIEHDFFGILGSEDEGEVYWSDTVELGDQNVGVDLNSPDEASVASESLDIAAAMISSIEELDSQARESLVAELSSEESATLRYINEQLEELDDDALDDAIIWDSGDRQIDFLRSLRLQRIGFHPHHGGSDEHFALLDYSISPDDSDSLLVVTVDVHGDTVAVAVER
ncbi:DUF2004 domain-containing protein [Glaciibacter superstes]|uniref:DUF2004 domain-containing protein n=1 Tax=Glaciibacter superstes TaxID=501023 RepID=UPI0003B3D86A|nr:DUF2004 domain-containing protein [Glaciibacter superstes]